MNEIMYRTKKQKMFNNNYKAVGQDGQEITNSEHPLHPGYLVEMEIEARGLKKQDVAHDLGIRPQHLSELMSEKRNVSALLAIKLEQVFGIDAGYWLRVQLNYDLVRARKQLHLA